MREKPSQWASNAVMTFVPWKEPGSTGPKKRHADHNVVPSLVCVGCRLGSLEMEKSGQRLATHLLRSVGNIIPMSERILPSPWYLGVGYLQ